MAHVLRHPRPKIEEAQLGRLKFEPGDRVLVKTYSNTRGLDAHPMQVACVDCKKYQFREGDLIELVLFHRRDDERVLVERLKRWAGCEVGVLVNYRLLGTSAKPTDKDYARRLRRSVEKWAGGVVEVMVYNGTEMEIHVKSCKEVSGSLVDGRRLSGCDEEPGEVR